MSGHLEEILAAIGRGARAREHPCERRLERWAEGEHDQQQGILGERTQDEWHGCERDEGTEGDDGVRMNG